MKCRRCKQEGFAIQMWSHHGIQVATCEECTEEFKRHSGDKELRDAHFIDNCILQHAIMQQGSHDEDVVEAARSLLASSDALHTYVWKWLDTPK